MPCLRSFLLLFGACLALAAPKTPGTQARGKGGKADVETSAEAVQDSGKACFITGSRSIPTETDGIVKRIQSDVQCDTSKKTISNVPDVTSGSITFSSIDFSKSKQTPLAFALKMFATNSPLASNDLDVFQEKLNVYQATEAGIRSEGGVLKIKIPKFFLAFQVARIKAAQGEMEKNPGQTVEHLLEKVLKNSAAEKQALKDEVTKLSKSLK